MATRSGIGIPATFLSAVGLVVLATAACSGDVVAPSDGTEAPPVLDGRVSTVLHVHGQEDGSGVVEVSSRVQVRFRDGRYVGDTSDERITHEPRSHVMPAPEGGATVPPHGILRPQVGEGALTLPPIAFTGDDGASFRVTRVADRRGQGRPPVATLVYRNDRIFAISTHQYRRSGDRFVPIRARTTVFDESGHRSFTLEHDLGDLAQGRDRSSGRLSQALDALGLSSLWSTVGSALTPAPLEAAPAAAQLEDCSEVTLTYLAAQAVWVAALSNLALAVAACGFSGGVACPAVLTATALAAAATAAMLAANAAVNACYSGALPPDPYQGDGGGEVEQDCWVVDWYISYDNGWTWHYLYTEIFCP